MYVKTGKIFWHKKKLLGTIFYTVFELYQHLFSGKKICNIETQIFTSTPYFYTVSYKFWRFSTILGVHRLSWLLGTADDVRCHRGRCKNCVLVAQIYFGIFLYCVHTHYRFSYVKISIFTLPKKKKNINHKEKKSPKKIFYLKKKKQFIISQIIRLKLFLGFVKQEEEDDDNNKALCWLHGSNYIIMFNHKPYL